MGSTHYLLLLWLIALFVLDNAPPKQPPLLITQVDDIDYWWNARNSETKKGWKHYGIVNKAPAPTPLLFPAKQQPLLITHVDDIDYWWNARNSETNKGWKHYSIIA